MLNYPLLQARKRLKMHIDSNENTPAEEELILGMTEQAAAKYCAARIELDSFLILLKELCTLISQLKHCEQEITIHSGCLASLAVVLGDKALGTRLQFDETFVSTRKVFDLLQEKGVK